MEPDSKRRIVLPSVNVSVRAGIRPKEYNVSIKFCQNWKMENDSLAGMLMGKRGGNQPQAMCNALSPLGLISRNQGSFCVFFIISILCVL